jgi:hypothetical protein
VIHIEPLEGGDIQLVRLAAEDGSVLDTRILPAVKGLRLGNVIEPRFLYIVADHRCGNSHEDYR